jgi:precorrin-6B methylase 1
MPFTTEGKRDYKKELNWEHKKKPKRVKERAKRNAARTILGLKKGDPRHASHKNDNAMDNRKSNLKKQSASANLKKEADKKKKKST